VLGTHYLQDPFIRAPNFLMLGMMLRPFAENTFAECQFEECLFAEKIISR
jgi:hypothetical protein